MNQTPDEAAKAFRHAFTTATIGELNFPTSLDASRRILTAVENPDLGPAALARIIVAEPLLSAKVMRLANSVALNPGKQPIRDLGQAVLCVGLDLTKALAIVVIIEQLRQSPRHGACRDLAKRLWERSIHVAALSYVLSKKLTALNADEVMLSAIVHDLGRFYLLAQAADYPGLLDDFAVLAQTVNDLASDASTRILDKLKLPASVVDAVLAARTYSGAMQPRTTADILFLAGIVSPCGDPLDELDARVVRQADGAAVFGLDPRTLADLMAQSSGEIRSLVVALES